MIALEDLFSYLPKQHGEHGVDATLHMLAKQQEMIHEVFSNPPGGSWTVFDIIRPNSSELFRWDHMPRVPGAKRPDWVLQFNQNQEMNFLIMESKQSVNDVYNEMGPLHIQFFTGSGKYLGLMKRPTWHRRGVTEREWKFIPPEEEGVRYWFKHYPSSLVKFWPGYAYCLNPEHYNDIKDLDLVGVRRQLQNVLDSENGLEIAIGVGWRGKYHEPFVVRDYSTEFKRTKFASELDKLLGPSMLT